MSLPPELDAPTIDLRRSDVLIFEGRFPDPSELLKWGGHPGLRYLMINSINLNSAIADEWQLCRDVPVYQIKGPNGTVSFLVLSKGIPIRGADPANGVREWFYDKTLLTNTGLKSPYGGTPNGQEGRQSDQQGDSQGRRQGTGNRDPQVARGNQAEGPAPSSR